MERKDQWKCPECTSKRPKKGNSNTPVRGTTSIADDPTEIETTSYTLLRDPMSHDPNITVRSKIARALSPSEKGSPEHDNKEHVTHSPADMLTDLKIYLRNLLHTEINGVKKSIDNLTSAIKEQNTRIEQLEARVSVLESRSDANQTSTSYLQSIVTQLQTDIAERDQAFLLNDIEIAGCPEVPSENSTHIVLTVAKKIGVEIDEKDIVSAERVGLPRNAGQGGAPALPRPLAVRLARRATRNALLQAARTRREINSDGFGLPGPTRPLYVNERLTKYNRQLFQKARALARELQYKYVWTREGKIYVRKEHGKPRYRLRNESDLSNLPDKTDSC